MPPVSSRVKSLNATLAAGVGAGFRVGSSLAQAAVANTPRESRMAERLASDRHSMD
jgi:hypothetical protein